MVQQQQQNQHPGQLFVLYDERLLYADKPRAANKNESVVSSPTSHTVATSIYGTRRTRRTASTNTRDFVISREELGSLRPESPPISLLSSEFLGLAVTAFIAGLIFAFFDNGFIPMFTEMMLLRDPTYPMFLRFLYEWPVCFSVFMGFLSDCRPIGGRRRQPYMIIGFAVAGLLLIGVAVIDYVRGHSWRILAVDADHTLLTLDAARHGPAILVMSIGAKVMLQLMLVATLSMTVEFAQRESLMERGRLQASFYGVMFTGLSIGLFIMPAIVFPDLFGRVRSSLSLGDISLVMASMCFVPIPFIIKFLDEPYMPRAAHFSLRRRMHEFWRFCHQDVVGRILLYITVSLFLLAIFAANARNALSLWCQISPARWQIVDAVDMVGCVAWVAFWGVFMINWSWHKATVWGTFYYVGMYIVLTVVVTYDITRTYAAYIILRTLADFPRASIKMFALAASTEVADHGREGVILGLVVGFQSMITMLGIMLSTMIEQPYSIALPQDILLDTTDVRNRVLIGSMIGFGINLLAIPVVFLLPKQKLDTQRRRASGGFNRYACYAIALMFVLLFIASGVANMGKLW